MMAMGVGDDRLKSHLELHMMLIMSAVSKNGFSMEKKTYGEQTKVPIFNDI
jgi:hypothetical protein